MDILQLLPDENYTPIYKGFQGKRIRGAETFMSLVCVSLRVATLVFICYPVKYPVL